MSLTKVPYSMIEDAAIDVKNYGAVGDGTTDDTNAIDAAIAAAGDGWIYYPEGTYKYTGGYLYQKGYGPGRIWDTTNNCEAAPTLPAGVVGSSTEANRLEDGGFAAGACGSSGYGTIWKTGYNPAWNGMSPLREGSAMELDLLPRGYFAVVTANSGTNSITGLNITSPISDFVAVGDIVGFGDRRYKIASITGSGTITGVTVTGEYGEVISFASTYDDTFRWCYLFSEVKVNIAGTSVSRIGGEPFSFVGYTASPNLTFYYNGTAYGVASYNSIDHITLSSSAGTVSNVWGTLKTRTNFFNIFRMQGMYGGNEENCAFWCDIDGSYNIGSQFAGQGKFRPLNLGFGYNADRQTVYFPLSIYANNKIKIGSDAQDAPETSAGALTVGRGSRSAAIIGGTDYTEVTRFTCTFQAANYRALSIGYLNNYQGAQIQSWVDKDATIVGSIYMQPNGGPTYIGVTPSSIVANGTKNTVFGGSIFPIDDNVNPCGGAAYRWSVIYAGTGTINTSDGTQKQDAEALDEVEKRVATRIKGLIKKFRFKDAVLTKGDDARIHVGVIAQDVKAAFEKEGLDADRYGMFCSDTLEDGSVQLGIRYDELLAFVISAL